MGQRDVFLGQLVQDVVDGLSDPAELDPLVPGRDAYHQELADVGSEDADPGGRMNFIAELEPMELDSRHYI